MTIELTNEEALVFFEWLASNSDGDEYKIRDEAERVAVWRMEGILEKALPEVLSPNYGELLKAAKEKLAVQHGGNQS